MRFFKNKYIRQRSGKKILVAMSGGVDSSVSALLLKEKGYEVVGATMCLGIKDNSNKLQCCGIQAIEDAKKVCRHLEIPHYVFDFSKSLEDKIINKFVSEYSNGRTPNPCVDCNRFLKFDILLNKAITMDFDYLATGHYAKIIKRSGNYYLSRPRDKVKDQTYFLYPIKKELLKFIKFPLGDLIKTKVREIAQKYGLQVANKPQSQDLCFAESDDFADIFRTRIKTIKQGPIINIDGKVLGRHKGICFYTIGQRKGLGISSSSPIYITEIDPVNNGIIVGGREALQSVGLVADNVNYYLNKIPRHTSAKIRYNHQAAKCVAVKNNGTINVNFYTAQEAITPGQSVVIYAGDIVVAGGEIKSTV